MITQSLELILESLKKGEPVGLPTETVYGLAAPINSKDSLLKIFEYKKRPYFDPLIVHVNNLEQATEMFKDPFEKWETDLLNYFWPGPLTYIKKKSTVVSDLITANEDTVAVRIPNHPLFLEVLNQFKTPLAAPSANLFGKISPTCAQHVEEDFSYLKILEGGVTDIGIESTILKKISSHKVQILRPGHFDSQTLSNFLKPYGVELTLLQSHSSQSVASLQQSPGLLEDHYQPTKKLIFINSDLDKNILNSLFSELGLSNQNIYNISLPDNPYECARVLYSRLRPELNETPTVSHLLLKLDSSLSQEPLWAGVINRLRKASTHCSYTSLLTGEPQRKGFFKNVSSS